MSSYAVGSDRRDRLEADARTSRAERRAEDPVPMPPRLDRDP